ncbi:MAG: hypothetical protein ACK5PB_09020 [Pirellula sp.]|jgi:hypothetical protein
MASGFVYPESFFIEQLEYVTESKDLGSLKTVTIGVSSATGAFTKHFDQFPAAPKTRAIRCNLPFRGFV